MLVGKRMTPNPVTVAPQETLASAQAKMQAGKFRRLPVVKDGELVGIASDRDMRAHLGHEERTKITAAMSEDLVTVTPSTTIESAAQLMLKRKIGGLPVVEDGKLVGIITTSDILSAFLEVMGATEEGVARVDLVLKGAPHDLGDAAKAIAAIGSEILSVGTYREKWDENRVFYMLMRTKDVEHVAEVLKSKGFTVLGTH
ncbi:MAG TPA: CBS and ACT domain-containing protein [Candidatus Binataceae bacterium]|nr:CBS and ACT domain-containing protein [Candidatus Binataceae bacterium]